MGLGTSARVYKFVNVNKLSTRMKDAAAQGCVRHQPQLVLLFKTIRLRPAVHKQPPERELGINLERVGSSASSLAIVLTLLSVSS